MTLNRLVDSSDRINILNHMVHYRLDATFTALADPTRRGMLAALASGEQPISKLAAQYPLSLAGDAQHVALLERAGQIGRAACTDRGGQAGESTMGALAV